MKLSEALEEVKKVKPNGFDDDTLTLFVNKLEQNAFETLRTPPWQRKRYKWSEDADVTLVIPPPYDAAYISWLKAQIDFNNEEHASYANNQAQFNIDYEEFEKWVVRTGAATPTPPKKISLGKTVCPPPVSPPDCEIDIPQNPLCKPPHLMFDSKDIIEATQAAVAAAGNATTAADEANKASSTANEVIGKASDAADKANEQAGRAESAANNANELINTATDILDAATEATEDAVAAANSVDEMKEKANQAAANADLKAQEASDAAIKANNNAKEAETAAEKANNAAEAADNKITEMNQKVVAGDFDGATFTPAVDDSGNLSWTNDKGMENPPSVNIKGPKGEPGGIENLDTVVNHTNANSKNAPTTQAVYEAVYSPVSGPSYIASPITFGGWGNYFNSFPNGGYLRIGRFQFSTSQPYSLRLLINIDRLVYAEYRIICFFQKHSTSGNILDARYTVSCQTVRTKNQNYPEQTLDFTKMPIHFLSDGNYGYIAFGDGTQRWNNVQVRLLDVSIFGSVSDENWKTKFRQDWGFACMEDIVEPYTILKTLQPEDIDFILTQDTNILGVAGKNDLNTMVTLPNPASYWGNWNGTNNKYCIIKLPSNSHGIFSFDIRIGMYSYGQAIYHVEGYISSGSQWNSNVTCYSTGVVAEGQNSKMYDLPIRFGNTASPDVVPCIIIGDGTENFYNTSISIQNFVCWGEQHSGIDILNHYKSGWSIDCYEDYSEVTNITKTIEHPLYSTGGSSSWDGGTVTGTVHFESTVDFTDATVKGLPSYSILATETFASTNIQQGETYPLNGIFYEDLQNLYSNCTSLVFKQNSSTQHVFHLISKETSRNEYKLVFGQTLNVTGAGLIYREITIGSGMNYMGLGAEETGISIVAADITAGYDTFVLPVGGSLEFWGVK